jgi:DNA-binding NarL/FixJ family response regulator
VTSVLIADDQEMVRTGFRMILEAHDDLEVVAEAADGVAALSAARRLRPDVCLLDVRMPGIDGIELTEKLAGGNVSDPLKVVVVTTFDLDEYVYGALRAGAAGFLLKDSGPALLVEAVRAAADGQALISPAITVRLLEHMTAVGAAPDGRPAPEPTAPPVLLTDRELDVVRALARGRTNAEIAADLFVSLSTVKTHLGHIQAKIGARNRVEIVVWAWETGLMG